MENFSRGFENFKIWVMMLSVFLLSSILGSQVKAGWENAGGNVFCTTGSVGIGTNNPGNKLHVSGGGILLDNNQDLRSKNAAGIQRTILYLNSSNLLKLVNEDGNVSIPNGNVGIGTTTPGGKLQIISPDNTYPSGLIPSLSLRQLGNNAYGWDWVHDDNVNGFLHLQRVEANVSTNVMSFDRSTGNVGIGTTDPGYKLDIKTTGSEDAQIAIRNTSTGNARIYFDAANGDLIGSDYSWLGQDNNLKFGISTSANAGDIYLMPKNGAGNVGIGTATPQAKLDVAGDLFMNNNSIWFRAANNYINSPATSVLALTTNGSERMRVDANGNVGIGTTEPVTQLHMKQVGSTIPRIRLEEETRTWQITTDTSPDYFGISDITAGKNPLVILGNSGNVGIGTPAPGDKLDIMKTTANGLTLWNTTNMSGEKSVLSFNAAVHGLRATIAGIAEINGNNNGALAFSTHSGSGGFGLQEHMRITSTGNVGIGTPNPGQLLETYGLFPQIKVTANPSVSSAAGVKLKPSTGNGNDGNPWYLYTGDGITPNTFLINYNDSRLVSVKSSGYVGIGTTNPQSLLAVNGTITSKEVVVTNTGWSDFVFNDNYKLMKLDELEKSIKENKHLPEIPSAKEVSEKGVSVGEMQAKLLQKVEELTLYVIEQNKRLAALEKENVALKVKGLAEGN